MRMPYLFLGPLYPKRGIRRPRRIARHARGRAPRKERLILDRERHGLPCDKQVYSR